MQWLKLSVPPGRETPEICYYIASPYVRQKRDVLKKKNNLPSCYFFLVIQIMLSLHTSLEFPDD